MSRNFKRHMALRARRAKERAERIERVTEALRQLDDSCWEELRSLLASGELEPAQERAVLEEVAAAAGGWARMQPAWMARIGLASSELCDYDREQLREWIMARQESPAKEGPAAAARWILACFCKRVHGRNERFRGLDVSTPVFENRQIEEIAQAVGAELNDAERSPILPLLARELVAGAGALGRAELAYGLVESWMRRRSAQAADRADALLRALGIDRGRTRMVSRDRHGLHLIAPGRPGETLCGRAVNGRYDTRVAWADEPSSRCRECEGSDPRGDAPDFENGPSWPIGLPQLDGSLWAACSLELQSALVRLELGEGVTPGEKAPAIQAKSDALAARLIQALERTAERTWPRSLRSCAADHLAAMGPFELWSCLGVSRQMLGQAEERLGSIPHPSDQLLQQLVAGVAKNPTREEAVVLAKALFKVLGG